MFLVKSGTLSACCRVVVAMRLGHFLRPSVYHTESPRSLVLGDVLDMFLDSAKGIFGSTYLAMGQTVLYYTPIGTIGFVQCFLV